MAGITTDITTGSRVLTKEWVTWLRHHVFAIHLITAQQQAPSIAKAQLKYMTLPRQNTQRYLPLTWRYLCALSLIMLVLQYSVTPLLPHAPLLSIEALAFEPQQPFTMPWRIFTTHLVHLSWIHLLSNLLGFICVCLIFYPWLNATPVLLTLGLSMLAATLLPAALSQQASFAGFSAVIHGIIAFAALAILRPHSKRSAWISAAIIIALLLKVSWELKNPGIHSTLHAFPTAGLAHAGGILGGALSGLICWLWQRINA